MFSKLDLELFSSVSELFRRDSKGVGQCKRAKQASVSHPRSAMTSRTSTSRGIEMVSALQNSSEFHESCHCTHLRDHALMPMGAARSCLALPAPASDTSPRFCKTCFQRSTVSFHRRGLDLPRVTYPVPPARSLKELDAGLQKSSRVIRRLTSTMAAHGSSESAAWR